VQIAIYHNLPSGGAKRALLELTRRLSIQHTLDVYTLESANHEFGDLRLHIHQHKLYPVNLLAEFGSPFGRVNPLIRLVNLQRVSRVNKRIALDIETAHYDVVFVNPCQFETAPSLLRFIQKTPTVYFCHEPPRIIYEEMPERPYELKSTHWRNLLNRVDPLPSIYYSARKRIDRLNILCADEVLVNSRFMGEIIRKIYDIDPQVCYLGSDIEMFDPNGSFKSHGLLSVGSLTPLKGFDFLVEALANLSPELRPPLWIASNFQNPSEHQYISALAARYGIKIEFFNNISDSSLAKLYNQASITVYAPIREPFGLVPLESMASGTPVVAVREGGMQETILDGETGFLVERDPVAFADAIQKLLDDSALAKRMGERGRQHVLENWTWDQATARLEGYLHTAAKLKAANHQQEIQH
jgi:glycosyltransferase involved in cell wall biosynthesis